MGDDPVLEAADGLLTEAAADLEAGPVRAMKAVTLVEAMEEDGSRRLWIIRDQDIANWEIRGMMHEMLSDLSAFDLVDILDPEDG